MIGGPAIPEHTTASTILFAAIRQAAEVLLTEEANVVLAATWEVVPSSRFFQSEAYRDLRLRLQVTHERRYYPTGVKGSAQVLSAVPGDVFSLHVWWFSPSRDQLANAQLPRGHQTPHIALSGDPMKHFYIIPAIVEQLVSLDERAAKIEMMSALESG